MNDDIPKDRDTLRAYRLWDAHTQEQLHGRWYRWEENAKDAAVVICRRELKIGRTIELLNVRRGKLLETYTRRVSGIDIKKSRHLRAEERLRKPVKGEGMKTITMGALFTDAQLKKLVAMWGEAATTRNFHIKAVEYLAEQLPAINQRVGQDNDARYLAYLCERVFTINGGPT